MAKGDGQKKKKIVRRNHLQEMIGLLREDSRTAYTTQELIEIAESHTPKMAKSRKTVIEDLKASFDKTVGCRYLQEGGDGGRMFWIIDSPKQENVVSLHKKALKMKKLEELIGDTLDEM